MKPTVLFSLLASLVSAAHLTITLPAVPALPNPSTLPSSTTATLISHGTPLTAHISRTNTFVFSSVNPGSYLLTLHSRDHFFEPLRIDVSANDSVTAWQTFRGNEWGNRGEVRGVGDGREKAVEVEVRCLGGKEFYAVRAGFSMFSILKNPMILMALFSLAVIVGMPYLMENMDPETRAEFEEMQKKSPISAATNTNSLQNFDLAGWMAGKPSAGSGEQTPQEEPARQESSGGKKGGGRRKG
ncbi:hypothetical protein K402DRAFT_371064 [Aulographum hederae CBS 113979]|uniref:ER membrane protein complex subunit 7 beta-sandwich domain-containing protein n=1 Tax=Aulographum hederae CBS 113979 TaxID=1176131 RepID=A0A6G1HA41_9PEZI|nr:hypothetical protein K402DRAFT_371064 [Aulographum hederae CBS 113979]